LSCAPPRPVLPFLEAAVAALGALALALDERLIDVMAFDECLDPGDQSVRHGHSLDRVVALVRRGTPTVAVRTGRDGGMHPVELREMVTSPGGTTIAAIRELEQAGVRAAFLNAIQAAMVRSKELAEGG